MASDRTTGDFGSKLRAARELRGITLRQIANATKISVSVLDGLERNDISRLPGGIFGRAFVRSYATEVGLDPEETIQQFIAQFPHNESVTAGRPVAGQIEDRDALESDRRMATTFLRLIALSVPIAVMVMYFGAFGGRAFRSAGPSAGATPTSTKPEVPATVVPAGTQGSADTPEPASSPTRVPPEATSGTSPSVDTARLTVGLSASRPCWVSATADGQKILDRLLEAGERSVVEVHREFVFTVGDAGAISLTLNGALARPLGKTSEVVTARITLANFRSYLAGR